MSSGATRTNALRRTDKVSYIQPDPVIYRQIPLYSHD